MNTQTSVTYLILSIALLFFACNGPQEKEKENTEPASAPISSPIVGERYVIDKQQSTVRWEGSMVIEVTAEEHAGYIYLSKGELGVDKGKLAGGWFEIDMNTMEYHDKQHPNTPIKHLKSADFFDVEKFPFSRFEITKVAAMAGDSLNVTGNLTIKGITQPITFPASVEIREGIVHATGRVTIDRTEWGIRYKSGKFYDNLADEAVSDNVEFEMKIVARKQVE